MKKDILKGKVAKGYQIASGSNPDKSLKLNNTIFLQKPFFKEAGIPDIEKYYNGTINLDISPNEFKIIKPDYEVTCNWIDEIIETFWFVKIFINFDGKKYRGLIYYPCPSKVKSHSDYVVELLTKKIPNLNYANLLSVEIPAGKIRTA